MVNGLPLPRFPANFTEHLLFASMVAFWPLVCVSFALFRRVDSATVNELKCNSAGNNNEVRFCVPTWMLPSCARSLTRLIFTFQEITPTPHVWAPLESLRDGAYVVFTFQPG